MPLEHEKGGPRQEAAHSKSLTDYSNSTDVGPRTAALGFTRADIDASKRKSERIERARRSRDARRELESSTHRDDVMVGLRALWRVVESDDRPALERLAAYVRGGAL